MVKTRKRGIVSKLANKARSGMRKATRPAGPRKTPREVKQPVTPIQQDHD